MAFQEPDDKSSSESQTDDNDKPAQVVLNFSHHQQNKVGHSNKKRESVHNKQISLCTVMASLR